MKNQLPTLLALFITALTSLPVSALTDWEEEMAGQKLEIPTPALDATIAQALTTSGFPPAKESDTVFVVNSGPDLDTACLYNDHGPIQIHLPIRRVIGDIQKLMANGVLKETARLQLPVFDVDLSSGEFDLISFNGLPLLPEYLLGANGIWYMNTYTIPIEWINFPSDPGIGKTVEPADNLITIDIDALNYPKKSWCTAVDWVELSLDMPAVPVVFVHGILSDGEVGWDGASVVQQIDALGLPNSGTEVSLGRFGTLSSRLPELTKFIDGYKDRWGMNQLTLVAHSRGGLDARNYIGKKNRAESILQLVQFATPNAGTPIFSNPSELSDEEKNQLTGNADPEMTEDSMAEFNKTYPVPKIVGLASIAGHAKTKGIDQNRTNCANLFGIDLGLLDAMNGISDEKKINGNLPASDGLVPVSSAHALSKAVNVPPVVSVTPADRTACHTQIQRNNSPAMTTGITYIKHPTGTVAVRKSGQVIQNSTTKIASKIVSKPLGFHLGTQTNLVNKGSTGEFSFWLPGDVPIDIELRSSGSAKFNATYITPSGAVLQPGAGVEIESYMAWGIVGPIEYLHLDAAHAVQGTWKVRYEITDVHPEALKYSISLRVSEDSVLLTGTFSQPSEFIRVMQSSIVTVSLLNNSIPLQGATVKAQLSGNNIATFVESSTTPGTYEAVITPPASNYPNYCRIVVISGGVTRYAGAALSTLPATPALGTAFTDQGIASPENGLYDLLDITIPVMADKTQEYQVSGTLRTSSGKVISTDALANLNAGATSIHLQFDGEAIYKTGDDGPYTVENIRLIAFPDGLSAELIDVLADFSYQTAPYSVKLFQHNVVDIDPAKEVTSIASDKKNNDGKLDHLQVTIPIISTEATASPYTWSGSLYDVNGMLLSIGLNQGTIAPGLSTITLNFAGNNIGPNAIDSPFLLGGFLLYGNTTLSQTAVAQITTPSIDQFEGFVPCSLVTTDVQFPDAQYPNNPITQSLAVTNVGTARCVLTGIATDSSDFAVAPGESFPLILEAGATVDFLVDLVQPTVGSHTATITLAASGNQNAVATATATAVVIAAAEGITVNPTAGLTTTEAGGTATFTVVLNSQPTANVTINLSSSDTTEGTVSPASVTFTTANFGTAQTVTVTGVDDLLDDGDIAYSILTAAASSADGIYNGLNAADVAVTNTDNDTAGITVNPTADLTTTEAGGTATFTVVLNSQPTGDVTINLSSSDTTEGTVSPASVTFTTANFGTAQTVTVTGVNDALIDGDIAYTIVTAAASSADGNYNGLNAADVAVTNTDNDVAGITVNPTAGLTTTEAGGTATFTVVLNTQPTGDVTINLSSLDTTEGTVSPASVTFTTGNFGTAQTVTVTGVDDLLDDGDIAYNIVTAAATSTDGSYSGMNAADVAVSNTDNDTAGITVNPTSGLITTEAGGTASFTVVLDSQPTADVSIAISSADTTEGTVNLASLTFTPANFGTAQTVTVTGVDDLLSDGNIAYSILTAAATSADGSYNGLNAADVAVTNTDNDTAGITVNPTSGLTTTEAGGTATFTVVLNSQPTADVSINLSSSDTTEGTVSPASLTFTTANFGTAQTVTVTGVDDLVVDGNIGYTVVTAAASSADGNYNGLNAADVAVTNTDNDVDTDGDGVIDSIEGNGDRDGDGIPNAQDYDPTGYFYDEATGQIISGGRIFVACDVGTPQFVNNLNGTNGFYQFVVSNVGTPSTCNITLAIPTGYSASSTCLSGGLLDVNPGPNPQSLGSNENGNSGVLVNNTCAANPFFLSLRINPGDADVLNNNIPLTALQAVTPVPTLSQWVLMLLAGLMLVVAGWSLRQVR